MKLKPPLRCLRKWYESPQFETDYQKFITSYPDSDLHPKLGFRIQITPKKEFIKQEIERPRRETIKCFIFESLFILYENKPIENHHGSTFLKTTEYLDFVNQN